MKDFFDIPMSLMPAEWDARFDAVMIAWPHAATDWAPRLPEVEQCYHNLAAAIVKAGQKLMVITPEPERVAPLLADLPRGSHILVKLPTNDTWIRDYGPLTTDCHQEELLAVCYKFNGWGLKFASDKDNLVNLWMKDLHLLPESSFVRKYFVLEGGSVESDGKGTIMTTSECLLSMNRNSFTKADDKPEIEAEISDGLGAQRVLWLDHGALEGDDTDSHIDTLARFAPNDTILYVKSYRQDDSHNANLEKMEEQLRSFRTLEGQPYNLIGLPLPEPIYDEEGERLPATYANFLITPKAVLMPTYDQPRNDEMAAQMLRIAFPDHEIITVDCRELIRQHGSLHCATMQFPAAWAPF